MDLIISNNKNIIDNYPRENKINLGNNFCLITENFKDNFFIYKDIFLIGNILF